MCFPVLDNRKYTPPHINYSPHIINLESDQAFESNFQFKGNNMGQKYMLNDTTGT